MQAPGGVLDIDCLSWMVMRPAQLAFMVQVQVPQVHRRAAVQSPLVHKQWPCCSKHLRMGMKQHCGSTGSTQG
jgi:hypothetical protein